MRKIIVEALMASLLLMLLVACGGSTPSTERSSEKKETSEEPSGGSEGIALTTVRPGPGATLKLILYGLVAFVPNSGGTGMTAILVKDKNNTHQGVLASLKGTCEDDCGEGKSGALVWRLDEPPLELADRSRKFLLSIEGLPGEGLSDFGLCPDPPPTGREDLPGVPEHIGEPQPLGWIPCMRDIVPELSTLPASCLGDLQDCFAKARFSVDNATTAQVCHFVHGDVEGGSQKEYDLFDYSSAASADRRGPVRVLGDAILLTFAISKPSVTVSVRESTGGPPILEASLKPVEGEILLVLSNNPPLALAENANEANPETAVPLPENEGDKDPENAVHEHFGLFYNLRRDADQNDIFLPTVVADRPSFRGEAPYCEEEIHEYESTILRKPGDGFGSIPPHNLRECDSLAFTGASQ